MILVIMLTSSSTVNLWHWCRRHKTLILIVGALTVLSFGLGYLTGRDESRAPIIIEKHSVIDGES